ncbi:transporter substrate-binding domain-containing protein [Pseudomonas synxantha]|uniref:transporter substrate-binding domain-containing protein n=1 Tax=Pseudomonas synxantha TaxID=47883 RepID=UPI00099C1FEC|nr:transporter substrate-binding domain-containing protein [Pseudomonas synxantha]OPB05924.1 hybrid sensor histidine kinase/response regulator [Pseudomonas synxantha]
MTRLPLLNPSCLVALCLLILASSAHSEPKNLRLIGRSKVEGYSVQLTESDWRWLREKGKLVLGTSGPDYSPLDITTSGKDYEGLTADVSGLLAGLLHTPIEIRCYDTRAQLVAALKAGEVDLVGSANRTLGVDPALTLSHPYAEDEPSLSIRIDDSSALTPNLEGKRIAMPTHYLPEKTVRAFYPDATLQVYPSSLSAMGAVAFGQADIYLGDVISANYQINNSYLNNVQVADYSDLKADGFTYALRRSNQQLLRIVNRALKSIPINEQMRIQRRWNAGDLRSLLNQHIILDEAERRWVMEHPRLKVAFNSTAMPLALFDERGRFQGMSAEILTKISFRTGLKFDVVEGGSSEELVQMVKSGEVDILAAFVPTEERRRHLYFSRPYFINPFVMLSRNTFDSPGTLDEMAGKKLAIQRASALYDYLHTNYPNVHLIETNNAREAMELVASGKVDAAANSLISARHLIGRHYQNELKVTSTIGTQPAAVSLAANRGALELHSILEKALLSITPQEMDKITNRWRNELLVEHSYWSRHKTKILQGAALATLLLLIAATWITYLRRLIGKRKQAELALSEQLSFMHVMLDGTPHPIYVRDKNGHLLDCNSAYLDAVRADKSQALGKTISTNTFADTMDSQTYKEEFREMIASGQPKIRDRQVTMINGTTLTIYHWMLPYRDSKAQVIGMIGGWIDISERQHLLEQLQQAKNAADEANRAKTNFLATMSHEIRTPLNAVIGMLELALKKAEQGVFDYPAIDVASDSAKGLLELIGDILDIARIESGKLSLTPEPASVRVLLESLMRMFDGMARQKDLQLSLHLDPRADRQVMMDPLRMKQILSNLLCNAIKFTAQGEVILSVEVLEATNARNLALHISVQDSGIGISPEDQARLFSPFEQAGNHAQAARSSSGLGLSICKALCEMMGGELYLNSVLGRGTQVELYIELPLIQEPLAAPPPACDTCPPITQALRVLIVDDYFANRLLLSKQLSYLGHHIIEAADGASGLRLWQTNPVDVVITDCNMPVMNGYSLARSIRREEAEQQRTACRIFGFTANAQPDEKDKCRQAGMDDCLFKPLSLNHLQARLCQGDMREDVPQEQCFTPPCDSQALIDITGLLLMTGGDHDHAQALLHDLANSTQADQRQLKALSTCKDLQALQDLAHRIKGGARIIKHQELIGACEALEAACAQKTDVTQQIDYLEHQLVKLAADLQRHDIRD